MVEGLTTITQCSEFYVRQIVLVLVHGSINEEELYLDLMLRWSQNPGSIVWCCDGIYHLLGDGESVLLHERVRWIFVTKTADCSQLYYCFLLFTIIFCKGVIHPCPLPFLVVSLLWYILLTDNRFSQWNDGIDMCHFLAAIRVITRFCLFWFSFTMTLR